MKTAGKTSLIIRFMILFAGLLMVLLSTFVVLIYHVRRIALEQAEYRMEKEHAQVIENVDTYLDSVENIAYNICYSTTAQRYFQGSVLERVCQNEEMRTLYLNTTVMLGGIRGMYLYDKDYEGILYFGQCVEKHQMESSNIQRERAVQYSSGYISATSIPVFSVIYPAYQVKEISGLGDAIGYAGLTIDRNGLVDLMASNGIYPESELFLVDENDSILATSKGQLTGELTEEAWTADEKDYICIQAPVERTGWRLISVMPKGVVSRDFQQIVPLMEIAAILVISLIVMVLFLIYREIFLPIYKLGNFMIHVADARGVTGYQVETRNEIGILAENMNHMLEVLTTRNQELRIAETKRLKAELARQQMEIMAYRNQVNPHFLHNTFECIRGIALYHNIPEIVEISQALSRMMRYAVKGEGIVFLREEVRYVNEYIKIINYRFDGQIRFQCNIPEEMLDMQVIKLCLQPLVENAVFHGLETRPGRGTLWLTGHMEKEFAVLTVEDDGMGMEPEVLESLKGSIERAGRENEDFSDQNEHIGIFNIARRLYLKYGKDCGITIESVPACGTRITLKILPEL